MDSWQLIVEEAEWNVDGDSPEIIQAKMQYKVKHNQKKNKSGKLILLERERRESVLKYELEFLQNEGNAFRGVLQEGKVRGHFSQRITITEMQRGED